MTRDRRPSAQTIAILGSLAEQPREWRYGYDLCRELDIMAGSMYPILIRLADRGLLATKWETISETGRPPRHLYRITRSGLDLVAEIRTASARRNRVPLKLRTEAG